MSAFDIENLLSFVVENISEGIFVAHTIEEFPHIRFTVWNKRMVKLTGYTIDEINKSGWYNTVFPNSPPQHKTRKKIEKICFGDKLRDEKWAITRADGKIRWLSISTSFIEDDDNINHVMASIRDITESKKAEEEREKLIVKLQKSLEEMMKYKAKLEVMALFDSLTGLPNRRLFFDRLNMTLAHNLRHNGMFSLLYLDLDGLKIVNDTLGHEAGDEVLCRASQRLKNVTRKSDTVARIGGDEFAIIVDQIKSVEEAEIVVKKIVASFEEQIQLSAGSVNVGVSIGISLFPLDSNDPDELIRLADNSMYTSKNLGKNTYTFFCRNTKVQEISITCVQQNS